MTARSIDWPVAVLATLVFIADLVGSPALSFSRFYLPCILLTYRSNSDRTPYLVAAASSVLTAVVLAIPSRSTMEGPYLASRSLDLLLFWITAAFVVRLYRSRLTAAQLSADIKATQAELDHEKALRLSESKYRVFVDHASDALFVYDNRGVVLDVNRRTCESLGYSKEELIGKSPPFFAAKIDLSFLDGLIRQLNTGQPVSFESLHHHRDGSTFPVEVRICPFAVDGQRLALAIARDITERKQAEVELVAHRQRLEVLSRQLITTQEAERRHLACELHDEIGQRLTVIRMNLHRAQNNSNAALQPEWEENLAIIDQTIRQLRNISLNLRPPQLDELGLVAALHWLVKSQSQAGAIKEELVVDIGNSVIPDELSTACYRITQEALTNSLRHGQPSRVRIELQIRENILQLRIEDDGAGFDVDAARHRATAGASLGLLGMQERVSLVNGRLTIESVIGQGTKVQAWFPFNPI